MTTRRKKKPDDPRLGDAWQQRIAFARETVDRLERAMGPYAASAPRGHWIAMAMLYIEQQRSE